MRGGAACGLAILFFVLTEENIFLTLLVGAIYTTNMGTLYVFQLLYNNILSVIPYLGYGEGREYAYITPFMFLVTEKNKFSD